MILIQRMTIGEARCEGKTRLTEDQEITYDPEEPVCIHIQSPMSSPMKSSASLFGDGFSEIYQSSLYTITRRKNDGTDATYTYGNRLRDYPVATRTGSGERHSQIRRIIDRLMAGIGYVPRSQGGDISYRGDGNEGGIDQIQTSIIDRLVLNPSSRRAVAITWSPVIDSGDHLNLVCLFRSNDMLSAWGQNAYGLAHMQKFILDGVNAGRERRGEQRLTQGWLETISVSAHMYIRRDQLELMKFFRKEQAQASFRSFQKT